MREKHLRDDELQEMVDRRGAAVPDPHLRACPSCRQRLGEYQRLFEQLAIDPGFPLSKRFSRRVVVAATAGERPHPLATAGKLSLLAGTLLLGVGSIFLFFDAKPLVSGGSRWFGLLASFGRSLTHQGNQLVGFFGGALKLLAGAGLVMLCIAFFDRLLRRRTEQRLS